MSKTRSISDSEPEAFPLKPPKRREEYKRHKLRPQDVDLVLSEDLNSDEETYRNKGRNKERGDLLRKR
jgi:hypothetical protein